MPYDSVQIARLGGAWSALMALTETDGSASHDQVHRLAAGPEPLRDLADAVHYLCLLHGRHPGLIDHALDHAEDAGEREWLESAANAFADERAYLVRLVAAAGPLPSTPGQAESEAAAAGQRHALEMLARSDRAGCASGAAIALTLDWAAIRGVLDTAGRRLGIDPPHCALPPMDETASLVSTITGELPRERALLFGAQQVYAQHRGLWSLLEARASARETH